MYIIIENKLPWESFSYTCFVKVYVGFWTFFFTYWRFSSKTRPDPRPSAGICQRSVNKSSTTLRFLSFGPLTVQIWWLLPVTLWAAVWKRRSFGIPFSFKWIGRICAWAAVIPQPCFLCPLLTPAANLPLQMQKQVKNFNVRKASSL